MSEAAVNQKLILQARRQDGLIFYRLTRGSPDPNSELLFENWKYDPQLVAHSSGEIRETLRITHVQGDVRCDPSSLEKLGQSLFNELFPPSLRTRLQESDAEYLVVEISRELLSIPWELVHDGSDFLSCRFAMGRIPLQKRKRKPSLRRKHGAALSFLIVSNPTGDLPSSTEEGESLWNNLASDKRYRTEWLNGKVDSESLKKWLKESDLIHYSGHSSRNGDYFSVAWRLKDGTFDPGLVSDQSNSSGTTPLLIFNNACGEGIESESMGPSSKTTDGLEWELESCLHFITTQSRLVDTSGMEFAESFYRYALNGEPIGKALNLARLASRFSVSDSDHSWAQYLLYGDPRTGLYGETQTERKLLTVVATKLVEAGAESGISLHDRFRSKIDRCMARFPSSELLESEGGAALLLFERYSEALRFTLLVQSGSHLEEGSTDLHLSEKIGVAAGEVLVERGEEGNLLGIEGWARDLAQILVDLASPQQILVTKEVFDSARPLIHEGDLARIQGTVWLDHGYYRLEKSDEVVGICEVGVRGISSLRAPSSNEKAQRLLTPDWEPILGWRPAPEQPIPPQPDWIVSDKLGAGSFGEVWRARHKTTGKSKVFKFCFQADRLRSLKREASLLTLLQNRLGERSDIVRIEEFNLDKPPYFLVMEDTRSLDLVSWRSRLGEGDTLNLNTKIEIVSRIALTLQAAHDAGVVHRDIKPSNVLIAGNSEQPESLQIRLTDFGIGRLQPLETPLAETISGFTETLSQTLKSGQGARLYAAPEVLMGESGSTRSDIYSLGVILYQFLIDDFSRPIAVGWENDIQIPELLLDLERCLARKPGERFRSPGELAENLRSLDARGRKRVEGEARNRREKRRKRVAVGLASLTLLVALVATGLAVGLRKARIAEGREREARMEAERGLYHSRIAEANSLIGIGEMIRAREILYSLPEDLRNWEWGRLVFLCNLDHRAIGMPEFAIVCMAISPDQSYLATGNDRGFWRILDYASERVLMEERLEEAPVEFMAFNRNSTLIAVGQKTSLEVWKVDSKRRIASLKPQRHYVGSISFSPKNDELLTGDDKGRLILYDIPGGASRTVQGTDGGNYILANALYFKGGKGILISGYDGIIKAFDVETLELLNQVNGEFRGKSEIAVSEDSTVLLGSFRGEVFHGDIHSFFTAPRTKSVIETINCMAISPDNRSIALQGDESEWGTFDIDNLESFYKERNSTATNHPLIYTHDGKSLLVNHKDGLIREWPVEIKPDIKLEGHTDFIPTLDFNPSGDLLATGSADGSVRIWNSDSGLELHKLDLGSSIRIVRFSHDGSLLVAGADSGKVVLWDTKDFETARAEWNHPEAIISLLFVPESKYVVTLSQLGWIKVFDIIESKFHCEFKTQESVTDMAYSNLDKKLITTGSRSEIWDLVSPERLGFLGDIPVVSFRAMEFLPNGNSIAIADDDETITFWDRKMESKTTMVRDQVSGQDGFGFSPDGKRLFTDTRIWDLENYRPIMELPNRPRAISWEKHLMAEGGEPRNLRILPFFPWEDSELSGDGALTLPERIENYKRAYWSKRSESSDPFSAAVSLNP